jgi:signal transduction histidine kinase
MAHELRNPLTGIQGFSEYLLTCRSTPKERLKALEYINFEAKRLGALSKKMLEADSLKGIEPELEKIEVKALSDRLIKMLNGKAKISVLKKIDFIYADKLLIADVLLNLLENAVNAGADRIVLTFDKNNKYFTVTVEDNGCGIAEENLKSIFTPFYRVDKSRSRENGGVGLGLSFCESVIKAQGGYINVSSIYGKGSVFTVFL